MSLVFLVGAVPPVSAQPKPSEGEGVLVGRISHIDGGQILRFVPEEKDWVATVKDAPFGIDDALYSDPETKGEILMPNGTLLRIGGDTQVQMIALEDDVTEVDVASGLARLYNNSSRGLIKATTPFGYVLAPEKTTFDLYVGDESVEVIGLRGRVDFVIESDGSRFEVLAGSSSLISDGRQVTSGKGDVDADWDDWNLDREGFWDRKLQTRGESVRYLPEGLHREAYALEENGSWERVEYEGQARYFWRPVHVHADWAPFTVGRWTVWQEDNCWVPDEPFGYVTHHYGNWVYVETARRWYWAPPVVRVAAVPLLNVGYGWYPGRVAWIHSGAEVGWVPLAPFEPYYSHRWWGPRSMVVANVGLANIHINLGGYRYLNHAVVVNQSNFWGVRSYTNVRIKNINKTVIINHYRPAPVVNQTVIKNYNVDRQRYHFTNVKVVKKPHQTVVNRIEKNRNLAGRIGKVNAASLQKSTVNLKQGKLAPEAKIARPKVTNKLVSENEVNKPKGELKFNERELKKKERASREMQQERARGPEDRPRKPEVVKPDRRPPEDRPEKAREEKGIQSPKELRSPQKEKVQPEQDRRRQREERPQVQEPRQREQQPPREDLRQQRREERQQMEERRRQDSGPSAPEARPQRREDRPQVQEPRQREQQPPREDLRQQRREERQQMRESREPREPSAQRENKTPGQAGEKKQKPRPGQEVQ